MARMTPVKSCLSLPEALVASSYLEDRGIITALNGYHHSSAAWHCLYALKGVQLSVLDIDLDAARELLREASSSLAQGGEDNPRPPRLSEIAIAAAALLLTGLPLPVWTRRQHRNPG